MRTHICKLGSTPAHVQLKREYKLKLGQIVWFREVGSKKWERGKIVRLHNDGWFNIVRNLSFEFKEGDLGDRKL